jgi:hypothetical protein
MDKAEKNGGGIYMYGTILGKISKIFYFFRNVRGRGN